MKKIQLDFSNPSIPPKGCAVTLGCFDGIHLGHQKIICNLKKEALKRKLKTALYMFYPHPQTVLAPEKKFKRLFTLEETQSILEPFGLDFFGVIPFDLRLSKWSPEEFVSSFIVPYLKPRFIVVGYDFSFGSQRQGNVSHLKSLGQNWDFEVQQIPPLSKQGEPVSTSRIKRLLSEGSIRKANALLGREFFFSGTVVRGEGRGRKLGYPTANLSPPGKLILKNGVYSIQVCFQKVWHKAVLNIGLKPTFFPKSIKKATSIGKISFEVHIIHGNFNWYGQNICVKVHRFLREERAFNKISSLKAQIQKDIQETLNDFQK